MINHGLTFLADGQAAAGKPAVTVTIPKQPRVSKSKGGHPSAEWNKGR